MTKRAAPCQRCRERGASCPKKTSNKRSVCYRQMVDKRGGLSTNCRQKGGFVDKMSTEMGFCRQNREQKGEGTLSRVSTATACRPSASRYRRVQNGLHFTKRSIFSESVDKMGVLLTQLSTKRIPCRGCRRPRRSGRAPPGTASACCAACDQDVISQKKVSSPTKSFSCGSLILINISC